MVEEEKVASKWERESGLPNDFDGYMTNSRFGVKEEYAAKVQATAGAAGGPAIMFLTDLVDKDGGLMGSQGWSIGSGWTVLEDGKKINHPKRANVVEGSMYGNLQARVIDQIKVDMDKRGDPTNAASWDGLGFHWMQEEHETVASRQTPATAKPATGLMPVEYLGELTSIAKPEVKAEPVGETEAKLIGMVNAMEKAPFQLAAMKMPDVASNDKLMTSVLDDSDNGFYATHKK